MKNIYKLNLLLVLIIAVTVSVANAGINDRFSDIELAEGNYILVPEISAAPTTPDTGYAKISVRANNIYFIDDLGVETSMIAAAAGGVANLDEAYDAGGAGAGATIAVDSGAVTMTGTHGTTNTLVLSATGTGHCLAISNTGTGKDISGTAGWSVTKAGAATFATMSAFTGLGNISIDDGVTDSPSLGFQDQTNETAVFVKTDAGVLGLTTDATDGLNVLTGNLFVGNGAAGTAAMDGEDVYIEGELEVDGAAEFDGAVNIDGAATMTSTVGITGAITLANGLTIDNAVNNSLEWNENSEEIKWTFAANALDLDSTTGVVTLEIFDGSAGTITHAADGAADDLTLSMTGAQDTSLILSSTGTAADALQITTTAGGIDISATGAATEDIDITAVTSSIVLSASEAIADAVTLTAPAGGIDISAGGVAPIDITSTAGTCNIVTGQATNQAIKLEATGTGTNSVIYLKTTDGGVLVNADGAANGDITLNAADDVILIAAGGASIDSGDWDISLTGAATKMASIGFDSGGVLYTDIVEVSNSEIFDLVANPKELVAAPGADVIVEVVSVVLILDYGTNVFVETADNLVVQYATSGDDITAAIEMTGFIDQAADTTMTVFPVHPQAANAAADLLNNPVELLNTDGGFTGNAAGDTTLTIYITYRLLTAGL